MWQITDFCYKIVNEHPIIFNFGPFIIMAIAMLIGNLLQINNIFISLLLITIWLM